MLSAIKCSETIDGGDIYLKKSLNLNGSAEEIFIRCNELMEKMIFEIVKKNPNKVTNMFCNGAKLITRTSKITKSGIHIEEYFNFFANLPNIKVLEKNYNIEKIGVDIQEFDQKYNKINSI